MNRTPVTTSSQIAGIGFDSGTLEIEFKPSKEGQQPSVYQYTNVPPETHQAMIEAESVGKFFYANIKGKFDYVKMPPEEKPADEAETA